MVATREDRIRQRAYEIWEREGRPPGREADHWKQAAEEIDDEGDLEVQDEPQEPGGETLTTPPAGVETSLQPGGTNPGGEPDRSRAGAGAAKAPRTAGTKVPTSDATAPNPPRTRTPRTKNPGSAGAAGKGDPTSNGQSKR